MGTDPITEAFHSARRDLLKGDKKLAVEAVNNAARSIRGMIESPTAYRNDPGGFVVTRAWAYTRLGGNVVYYIEPPDSFYEHHEVNVAMINVPLDSTQPDPLQKASEISTAKIEIYGYDNEKNPYSLKPPTMYSLESPGDRGVIPIFDTITALYKGIKGHGLVMDQNFTFLDSAIPSPRTSEEMDKLFPYTKSLRIKDNIYARQAPQRPPVLRAEHPDIHTFEQASIAAANARDFPELPDVIERLRRLTREEPQEEGGDNQ